MATAFKEIDVGVDFNVAVHAANWPTMQSLQICVEQHGWPIKIGTDGHPNWTKAFQATPRTLGLPVVFKGEHVDLEASFVTLSPTESFGYSFDRPADAEIIGDKVHRLRPDEVLKPVDINDSLQKLGANGVRFEHGDRVLTITFRRNVREWKAGFYVLAAVIECSGGYGFEFQQGKHGASAFANDLVKAASDDQWK